jgi:hypothetical protein
MEKKKKKKKNPGILGVVRRKVLEVKLDLHLFLRMGVTINYI